MTSKCHTIEDINSKLNFFGYRGEAIASIIDVSGTTEICSRHKLSQQTYSRIFHNGKAMPVTMSKSHRPSVGTTATIHDFFYNLPVRRRGISVTLELEQVKRTVESIALVNPSISFSVRDDATGECVLQTHRTNSVLARFGLLFGMDKITGVKDVSLSQPGCELSGFISIDGHHNKSLQFIYINGRIIKKTPLHRYINNMLLNSLVTRKPSRRSESSWQGKHQESGPELIGHRRTQDLFGIYMLQVKCPRSEYDICLEPAKTLIEFKDWDGILSAIEILVRDFLVKNSLTLGPIIPSGLILDCQDSMSPSTDDRTKMSTLVPESTADLTLEPLLQSRVVKCSHKLVTSLYSKLHPVYAFSVREGTENVHPSPPPANIPKSITDATITTEAERETDMHATIDREQSLQENLPVYCNDYLTKHRKPKAHEMLLPSDHSESGYQSQGDDQTFLTLTGTEFLSDQCSNEPDKHSTSESCCKIDICVDSLHSNVTNTAPHVMSVEPYFHSSSSFIKPHSKIPKDTSHSGSGHQIGTLYTHTGELPAGSMVDSNNRSVASAETSLIREHALTPNTSYRSPLQSSSISSKLSKLFKNTRRKNGLTSHSKTLSVRRSQAEKQCPPPTSLTSHHSTAFQHERSTSIARTENLNPDSVHCKLRCHKHDDRSLSLVPLTSSVVYTCTGTSNYLSRREHNNEHILTSDLNIQHHNIMHTPNGTSSPSMTQALPRGGGSVSNVIYPTCVSTETSVNTSKVHHASVSGTVSCQSLCLALDTSTSHEGDLDPGATNAKSDQLLEQISNSLPLQDSSSTQKSQLEDVRDHHNLSNSGFIGEVNTTRSDSSYVQIPHEHIGHSFRAVSIPEPTSSAATSSQEQIWKQVVDPASGKVLYMHSKSGNCVSSLPYDSTVSREVDSFASLFNKDTLDSNIVLFTDSSSALGSTVNSSTFTDVDFPRGASAIHPYNRFTDVHLQPSICCSRNDGGSSTSLPRTSSVLKTKSLLSTCKPQLELLDTKWRHSSEPNNVSSTHHSEMIAGRSFSDIFKRWKNPSFHGGDEVS